MVGLVLALALFATWAAHEARSALPRETLEAERAWSDQLEAAARATAAALAEPRPGGVTLPAAPATETFRLPGGARLAAPAPTGGARLAPGCALFHAEHVVNGTRVLDLANASRGCVELHLDATHARPVRYIVELGGVVRAQPEGAVVLAGPPLLLDRAPEGAWRVALVMPTLDAPARQQGLAARPAELDLAPLRVVAEGNEGPSAQAALWTLSTRHPAAWRDWYAMRFADAGWPPSAAGAACEPVDCSPGADGLGRVVVRIDGDAGSARDVDLSITHTLVRATLR